MSASVPEGWTSVKLNDVADETSDRVDNPSKSGYDRFVGLEHLDSGELTIRRWGSTTDLLSAMKLFKSGDILIGRRNAYLKRASKAEFDGVCSGDAYVVREKKGKIAEGLLPIILNSDSFWDYAIAHASGTMSKRAKWRDLAEYSFLLPSLEEQCRIATTLWAAEDCIVKGERFVTAAERAKQVLMLELFSKGIGHTELKSVKGFGELPKDWVISPIIDYLIKIIDYRGKSPIKTKDGIPLITAKNIREGFLLEEPREYIQNDNYDSWMVRGIPKPGDVLFTTEAPLGNVAYVPEGKIALAQRVITLCPNQNLLDNKFLFQMLLFPPNKNRILSCQSGTTVTGIRQSEFRKIKFAFPTLPEQRQIAGILTRCDETIAAARANVVAAKALKMKMINEMLAIKT